MAGAGGDLHIALGDGRLRPVKHEGSSTGARRSEGNGVGAEHRFLATVWHNAGYAVDDAERHEAFLGEWFNIRP